jgi:hypothetical protein
VGRTGTVGQAPRSPALAYVPRHCPQAAKSKRRLVLDALNLTRWSFCYRRQTQTCRVGVVTSEDDPQKAWRVTLS